MDTIASIIQRIGKAGAAIGAVTLLAVMLLIVSNIVYRFFGGVIAGTYELIGPLVVVTAVFALVYTALAQSHIVIKLLTDRLPHRIQIVVRSIIGLISLGLWGLIAWGSVGLMIQKAADGEATYLLRVPILPFRIMWELGLILFCLVLLVDLIKSLSGVTGK